MPKQDPNRAFVRDLKKQLDELNALDRSTDQREKVLGLAAEAVNDAEQVRIAAENRMRIMTRDPGIEDKDGKTGRGFGLPEDHPAVQQQQLVVKRLKEVEEVAIYSLELLMERHPLANFMHQTQGLGPKGLGRLLGAIGDPYWNELHDRPAIVQELWALCGLHVWIDDQTGIGIAPHRQRGEQMNWSQEAKKRAFLCIDPMIKNRSKPYRGIYDATKEKYADAVHKAKCVRCGPSGKPAEVGTPLNAGHIHARAIRKTMKELLKDLWIESRELHVSGRW